VLQGWELDVAAAILLIEQAGRDPDPDMRALMMVRLHTCDVPRLREHLSAPAQALIDELLADFDGTALPAPMAVS
jgi:hypothetical protein